MMKYIFGLMLATVSIFSYAQRTPLACQVDRSIGFKWEEGMWNVRNFATEKFILILENNLLTNDSVAKAIGLSRTGTMQCLDALDGDILCTNKSGFSMFFSRLTNKGGMSYLMGATSNNPKRDSVSVDVFTCMPY